MKQLLSFSSKAFFILGLCLSLSSLSEAQTSMEPHSEVPAQIRYAGIKDHMLQFDVQAAGLPVRSVFSITDEEGNLLYAERVSTGTLNKRYKVVPGLTKKLRFEVVGKGVRVKQTFDIARQLEERLVVTASL